MPLSKSLIRYLTQQQVNYDTVTHRHSTSAMQSAIVSKIHSTQVAKAVVVHDPMDNYLMAVIPAARRLHLKALEEIIETPLKLATEEELKQHFKDCENGAIPALGAAYNMEMVWDDYFLGSRDIYFEAGDHKTLVHVSGQDFQQLAGNAPHNHISHPETASSR